MIQGFRCKETEKIFHREISRKFPLEIQKVALRKLVMLNAAQNLADLKIPPANHLEALKKDRKGQHSIRVNQQWRLCFRFVNGEAFDVEMVDYH